MKKMTIVYKISFAALMIALFIILSRALSIPYFFGVPFLKISIASSVAAFSSFYLGPFFGFIVGTFGDIIGALAFPQGEFNILFTIASSLGGLMPYFIYKLLNLIKFEKKFPFILMFLLIIVATLLTIFLSLNDTISSYYSSKDYFLEPWMRGLIIGAIWLIIGIYLVGIFLTNNKYKGTNFSNKYNVSMIVTSIFLTYFIFKIPISSIVFTFVYQIDFLVVYSSRNLLGFFDSFVDSLLVIIALNVSLKFGVQSALLSESKLNFWRNLKWKKKN